MAKFSVTSDDVRLEKERCSEKDRGQSTHLNYNGGGVRENGILCGWNFLLGRTPRAK